MHLIDWKAKRAGGRITVYGKDQDGNDAKLVGVDEVSIDYTDGVPQVFAFVRHTNPPQVHTLQITA